MQIDKDTTDTELKKKAKIQKNQTGGEYESTTY